MPGPPTLLISTRTQIGIITLLAAGLAIGGFEAGRKSVDAALVPKSDASVTTQPPADPVSQKKRLLKRDHSQITVREIATVPFSELYDVLKSASHEQLLAWAHDLEQMPRGPRQRAAVGAYFKSLVQVDHRAAIEAVLHAKNLLARDAAIDGMMKAAPESIWADLAEMTAQLPYPGRGFAQDNLIPNWSRVDPVAASRFVEKNPFRMDITFSDEPGRVASLLDNWGEIDPSAARNWLEEDVSRQTADAFRALLTSWGRVDRAAAIDYAIANQQRPNFEAATNELVYEFVRSAKEDATRLILLLPPETAKAAVKNIADVTNPKVTDVNLSRPPDYQRPPGEIARWMVTLPVARWEESIGTVAQGWLNDDESSARAWFDQLPPEMRDVAIVSCCRAATSDYQTPDQAIKLGLTISDHRLRDATLGELLRHFQTTAPGALSATQRVNELPVSEEQKAYLRGLIEERENDR